MCDTGNDTCTLKSCNLHYYHNTTTHYQMTKSFHCKVTLIIHVHYNQHTMPYLYMHVMAVCVDGISPGVRLPGVRLSGLSGLSGAGCYNTDLQRAPGRTEADCALLGEGTPRLSSVTSLKTPPPPLPPFLLLSKTDARTRAPVDGRTMPKSNREGGKESRISCRSTPCDNADKPSTLETSAP